MPTYEYACEDCGKRYEKREGFDAPARQKCQFCGKTANRVLFAPPVVFKGSGFYKTDSRGLSAPAASDDAPSSGGDHSDRADTKTADTDSGSQPKAKPQSKSDKGASEAAAAG